MRIVSLLFVLLSTLVFSVAAQASEKLFFENIQGKWSGPGEIVAGKFKGTKFVCTFGGSNPAAKTGMNIDGSCRVGVFAQPMSAIVIKTAGQYVGKFLDGAKGEGMDVTGGRYTRERLVVDIRRKDLNGVMVANLRDPNKLNVTISVKHQGRLIPVIGMTLDRQPGSVITGSIK